MEQKLITEINIEDKAITHFASFRLQQAFNSPIISNCDLTMIRWAHRV